MSVNAFLELRDALKAGYEAAAPVCDRVLARNQKLPADKLVQVRVQFLRADPQTDFVDASAPVTWFTTLRTTVLARGDATASAEDRAGEVLAACYARAFADPSLAGLAEDFKAGAMEADDDEQADESLAMQFFDVVVQHTTLAHAIT